MAVTIASMGGGAQTCTAALLGIRWPEGDAPSIPRSSDRLGPAGCCPLDAGIRYNPPRWAANRGGAWSLSGGLLSPTGRTDSPGPMPRPLVPSRRLSPLAGAPFPART